MQFFSNHILFGALWRRSLLEEYVKFGKNECQLPEWFRLQ